MRVVKLGDVCDVITRGISPIYTEDKQLGVAVLNQKCIRDKTIAYEFGRLHNLSEKSVNDSKFLKSGDVLVNSTGHGTLGRTALVENVDQPALVDSHITILRPANGMFVPRYFAYLIGRCEKDFVEMATGTSGQTELPRALVSEYQISYDPSLEEQRRVVERLDAAFEKIDWAIELIEKNIVNSQLLFEKYLRDKMADPEWKTKKLPELATYFNGLTYRPSDVSDNGTIVLRSSNVQNDELEFRDPVRVNCSIKDKLYIETGDILMCSRNGSKRLIGKTAVIGELEERMTFGTFMMIIRSELNPYLIWFFKSSLFRSQLSKGEATQINQVTRYILDDVSVPLPPEKDIALVVYDLQNIFLNSRNLQKNYQKKVQHLLALKQSLLAQVFSQSEVK
jgi:type I restriction enzyme S subunit